MALDSSVLSMGILRGAAVEMCLHLRPSVGYRFQHGGTLLWRTLTHSCYCD
jgi:hypothetical protein